MINLKLETYSSNIKLFYPNNRVFNIVPVLVLDVKDNNFHCRFLSNPYYRLDLDTLNGSLFRYVYESDGTYDKLSSSEPIRQYSARCYEHILHDIYMPNVLKAGDILLCGNVYPTRKTADCEPVLV